MSSRSQPQKAGPALATRPRESIDVATGRSHSPIRGYASDGATPLAASPFELR